MQPAQIRINNVRFVARGPNWSPEMEDERGISLTHEQRQDLIVNVILRCGAKMIFTVPDLPSSETVLDYWMEEHSPRIHLADKWVWAIAMDLTLDGNSWDGEEWPS